MHLKCIHCIKIIQQTLKDCVEVQSIFGDIIVHGKSQEEHDSNLDSLFMKLREKALKVNLDKCQFNLPHISFKLWSTYYLSMESVVFETRSRLS